MTMFATIDALSAGTGLWESLQQRYPLALLPVNFEHATLVFPDCDVSLLVCRPNEIGEDNIAIELRRDTLSVVLTVTLAGDLSYVYGESFGTPLSEIAALDVLNLYLPTMGGRWQCVLGELVAVDDDVDGDV